MVGNNGTAIDRLSVTVATEQTAKMIYLTVKSDQIENVTITKKIPMLVKSHEFAKLKQQ